MSTVVQRNFTGGEIAPALYSRADTVKYMTGLRTMRNFYPMRHGGATSRPGTNFVAEVKDSTQVIRLIPFIFNASQTYVLEFGNFYMRVHKLGSQLREASKSITAMTNANPGVFTSAAHGYIAGDEIYFAGVIGNVASFLNARNFKVATVTTNTFTLTYMNGTAVDTTLLGSYTSSGTASRVYTIATPYAAADLATLNFTESADVITIAHASYPPTEIRRTGDISWTASQVFILPKVSQPFNLTISGNSGTDPLSYQVTSIDAYTGEESLPARSSSIHAVTNITVSSNALVTLNNSSGFIIQEGDQVTLNGTLFGSNFTGLDQRIFIAKGVTSTSLNLSDFYGNSIDTSTYSAFINTGSVTIVALSVASSIFRLPTTIAPILVTFSDNLSSTAGSYNIYRSVNGVYGFIGNVGASFASGTPWYDIGTIPNTTVTPPLAKNPFSKPGDYPAAVSYVQQRLTFGNTNNSPENVLMSRSGKYKNFTTSTPVQASDSITFGLVGRQVNAVRHILELSTPVIFTSGAEWTIHGDVSGVISPNSINARQTSYNGSSTVRPIVIGNTALFIQVHGNIIRDLAYEVQSDGYTGNDLTVFSPHLFDGFTIVDWDYQQTPHSIVWAVRSDGALLSLTYVKEHQVWGWARHDFTAGFVENVCVVPEGNQDALYLTIRRTVNGTSVRYIERMTNRKISNIVDFVAVDGSKTFDGRNTGATTMTMTGSGWTTSDTLTLTASVATFASTDIGNQIDFVGSDGTNIRFTIDTFTSSTVVTGHPQKTVPASMQAVAMTAWSKAIATITGLWHLEGKLISALGDGFVAASPFNASAVPVMVTNGAVTFDKHYAVIQVGLPFICDIQTLDLENVQGETMMDKKKLVNKVSMQLQETRGLWSGSVPPTNDAIDPLENLFEMKLRNSETGDSPVALATKVVDINLDAKWNSNGRVFVRQVDPVPATILSIAPTGVVPFRVGG